MPIKREFSAGGIVYKKQITNNKKPASPAGGQITFWLVAQHSQHKGWVFPKGLIGDHVEGESTEDTAVREVEEETGVEAEIIQKLKNPVQFFYSWQGEKRLKTVYYFLMKYVSGDITKHDFEMMAVEWLETEKVEKRLSYKSDKEAFEEVLKMIKNLPLG